MATASKVIAVQANTTSCLLLSSYDMCNLLGINTNEYDATKIGITILNADGGAFSTHLESAIYQSGAMYIAFKDKLSSTKNCRVNFILFYFK